MTSVIFWTTVVLDNPLKFKSDSWSSTGTATFFVSKQQLATHHLEHLIHFGNVLLGWWNPVLQWVQILVCRFILLQQTCQFSWLFLYMMQSLCRDSYNRSDTCTLTRNCGTNQPWMLSRPPFFWMDSHNLSYCSEHRKLICRIMSESRSKMRHWCFFAKKPLPSDPDK